MKQLIHMSIVAAAFAAVAALSPSSASAESVRTTRATRLMSRPGEKSRVVKRVPPGRTMKVLDRRGRWIKVRVGSQAGWVTRTSVRELAERKARSTTKRRRRRSFVNGRDSRRRGWSDGAPEDRIGADAVEDDDWDEEDEPRASRRSRARRADDVDEFDEEDDEFDDDGDGDEPATVVVTAEEAEVLARPSRRADMQFVAAEGDRLYVLGRSDSGNWIEVENEDGESGWVRASEVDDQSSYEYARMGYRANGGLGYTALGMSFASNGQGPLANYKVTSAAASLVVNGELLYAGGSDTRLIGADVQYRGTRAAPGIRYDDGMGNVSDIAFTMHEIDAGASYGYRFRRKDGLALFGRAGYHYSQFKIHNVEDTENVNIARLPSELLKGFTVGGKLIAPRLTKEIGVSVEAAYLLGGSRTQTTGLEDGATSRVSALWGIAALTYQWKPDLQLVGTYRYYQSTTDWAGQADGSMRTHNATQASRKDVVHTVSVGLGKTF
ncbi:MAG: hypothetical protein D6689_11280 [Deltaproteobacteria bacterium]|nr:MAG: hypothetical protein D6689_11280 [Deltaproteobacteria bacterium]